MSGKSKRVIALKKALEAEGSLPKPSLEASSFPLIENSTAITKSNVIAGNIPKIKMAIVVNEFCQVNPFLDNI